MSMGNPRVLPDGRRWNGLAYLHDAPTATPCTCHTCTSTWKKVRCEHCGASKERLLCDAEYLGIDAAVAICCETAGPSNFLTRDEAGKVLLMPTVLDALGLERDGRWWCER